MEQQHPTIVYEEGPETRRELVSSEQVETETTVGFLELLRELESQYQPPSRNTIVNSLLEEKYDSAKNKLKLLLKQAQYIALTTDGWTSTSNEGYLAVTAHFISNEWQYFSCLLSCFSYSESHTSQNLSDQLKLVVAEWEISDKVQVVITDNAANIVAAVRQSNWKHIPCFAHTLNLIVQHGIKLMRVDIIRRKVKNIVEYFHRSTQANHKLLSIQSTIKPDSVPLKLKNDVATRWNSTYYMMERVINLQEPLTVAVGLLHNPIELLSEDERNELREICKILEPFEQITVEISAGKSVTISKIIAIA
ncbi:hypothetical protein NQ315_012825 [Exocentrus adspersus]|uniref:DUF659 domain-containing protein n=1 Tax=Exocentrus adspersus TaxID=1586481 RepID=A0AAV8V843_9CUCU|nr:hypothetical protein NQ315_012825 [Exocentrus adspersus]